MISFLKKSFNQYFKSVSILKSVRGASIAAGMAVALLSLSAPLVSAQDVPSSTDVPEAAPATSTILILNSYNENTPWSKSVISPINLFVAHNENVNADILHLNCTLVTDSVTYNQVRRNVMDNYFSRDDISCVIFVGNLAFTLREDIKNRWEDIPMILLTRDLTIAPTDYYFTGFDKPVISNDFPNVSTLRPEYNFTAVFVPDFYKETVDMMVGLMPQMDKFVFLSDDIYFNRYLAREVEDYLIAYYPEIKFKWGQASFENSDLLSYYFAKRQPNTGLMLSSWFYETTGALGYPTLVSGDMSLLAASSNPVFSLRSAYMDLGVTGGVYADLEAIAQAITSDLEAMLRGEPMRDIPFFIDRDNKTPTLNYKLLQQYGLNAHHTPKDTVFINRPLTFWEKYKWQTLGVVILLGMFFYLLLRRNATQRREIETLSRHKQFVDNMPIPYTKAKVLYNEYMNAILNVQYTMSNQAFDELIRDNSDPTKPYLLFSSEFISEKTTEMIDSGAPVSFLHHFPRTDKYYIFTLCLVDTKRNNNNKGLVDTIDIFAIDVTDRKKNEESLKRLTQRLDMVIDVANLIPWEWDIKTDMMKFDAYSMYHRLKRSFDDGHLDKGESIVSTGEYMKLVYPEDREIVRSFREGLLAGKIKECDMQYRLVIARQNKEDLEWVDVRGVVTDTDENGMPLKVMGSMIVTTDRKRQEASVMEAKRKTAQAELLKSEFVTNLSREVRIQLNAIVGFANLMNETDDAAKRREFADIINNDTQHLLDYIGRIVAESSTEDQSSIESSVGAGFVGRPLNRPFVPKSKDETKAPVTKPADAKPADAKPADAKPADAKPIDTKAAESTKPAEKAPDTESASDAQAKPKSSSKPLVLVAEDMEGNFLLLKHYIPRKYEVIHAWTGKEAVDLYMKHHPDIVLMDIGMPIMDGYKATAEIRKTDTAVPIVAVTAYTSNSDRELILHSGFDDYVSKPVMRDTIIEVLEHYVAD